MGQITLISDYMNKMGRDGRLIVVKQNGYMHTYLCFSMCKDYAPFENKGLFEYIPHDEDGHICFIEQMASKSWTKELRMQIEDELTKRYPKIAVAIWFRPGRENDRKVMYRRKHEASL